MALPTGGGHGRALRPDHHHKDTDMRSLRFPTYSLDNHRPALRRALDRKTRRAVRHNEANRLGYLHFNSCRVVAVCAQLVAGVRRIGEVMDTPKTDAYNPDCGNLRQWIRVPASLLAGSQQDLADAIYAAGLIWKAGSACRHAHDCCGCRGYYTPQVVGRKGRALLISQNYYSNY